MESLFLSKIEQNQEFQVDKELTDNKLIEKYFQRILDVLFQTNDISLKYEFLLSFFIFLNNIFLGNRFSLLYLL